MKESSKLNHPNSLQSHNHQIFDMVHDERETHVSNYMEVRDLKFSKYEHHPSEMTREIVSQENSLEESNIVILNLKIHNFIKIERQHRLI